MRRTVLLAAILLAAAVAPPALRADVAATSFEGRPAFSEGDALGYFIWKDNDTWKVRWTTFGAERRFSGRVTVDGGVLRSFTRVDADTERRVLAPGRPARVVRGPRGRVRRVAPGQPAVVATRQEDYIEQESERVIRFLTRTDDDIDGFDFRVTGSAESLRFTLLIDERSHPEEVEVGRNNVTPREDPLVIRLR